MMQTKFVIHQEFATYKVKYQTKQIFVYKHNYAR